MILPRIHKAFNKSNKNAKTRNWSNQNPNPALKSTTGNNQNYKYSTHGQPSEQLFPKGWPLTNQNRTELLHEKTCFCCKSKDTDQPCGNRAAYQGLCFRYNDNTFPLLPKFEISSIYPSFMTACVGTGREPQGQVFSRRGSNKY